MFRPYIPVAKPFYGDFYSVYELDGIKYVHVFGYFYDGDNWQFNEVCRFHLPLAEFVKEMNKYQDKWDYLDEMYDACPQYLEEFETNEQCVLAINTFFDGKPADGYLFLTDLTEDTPVGNYIDLGR